LREAITTTMLRARPGPTGQPWIGSRLSSDILDR
jgi:hypothetical protein